MNKDFTYGKNFADFLGSFWSQIFDGGALSGAIGYASSEFLLQQYMDVMDVINSSSIYSVPVFSRQNVYPIFIRKSGFTRVNELPSYGSGGFYGLQPSSSRYLESTYIRYGTAAEVQESYFWPIADNSIHKFGTFAVNRLFEPSVVMVNESDFVRADGGIIFRNNIFDNPLFPVRDIVNEETGEVDQEIVVWLCNVEMDREFLYSQYGYAFTNIRRSSEEYRRIIQAVFEVVSKGPSFTGIWTFLAAISGSPITREQVETVEEIEEVPQGIVVVTDKNTYTFSNKSEIASYVKVGATLRAGQPLSSVVEVIDTTKKNWWKGLTSIPLWPGTTRFTDEFLSFPNKSVRVRYGSLMNRSDPKSVAGYFQVLGSKKALRRFWGNVVRSAKEAEINYMDALFQKYGPINTDGVEEKTPFMVNPAQVLCEDIMDGVFLPVKIKLNNVKDLELFFNTFNPIVKSTPVHVIPLFFMESELLDQHDLWGPQVSATTIDLSHVLVANSSELIDTYGDAWDPENEDNTISEAVSVSSSYGNRGQNSADFLDYPDRMMEKFDLSNEDNLVQTIELRLIKKCAN